MFEEDEPAPPPKRFAPPKLDGWSIAELQDYTEDLLAEVERAQAEIGRKQAHRDAAGRLFSTG